MKPQSLLRYSVLVIALLLMANSPVKGQGRECTVRNNSEHTINVCWVQTKTTADSGGDLGTTFTSNYTVNGWRRIVSGGEYDFSNVSHIIAWSRLPSGELKVWRSSAFSTGKPEK